MKRSRFLGVLTQIRINDHNRISTSDTRIIRRMVRDQQFRDRGPMATMDIWTDVRRGEEKEHLSLSGRCRYDFQHGFAL